jgi:hypothetical protein
MSQIQWSGGEKAGEKAGTFSKRHNAEKNGLQQRRSAAAQTSA